MSARELSWTWPPTSRAITTSDSTARVIAEEARQIIVNESGRHFDPAVVDAFVACFEVLRECNAPSNPRAPLPESRPLDMLMGVGTPV
jgi:hypothetical protein